MNKFILVFALAWLTIFPAFAQVPQGTAMRSTNGWGIHTTLYNSDSNHYYTNSAQGFAIDTTPKVNFNLSLDAGLYVEPNVAGASIDAQGGGIFGGGLQILAGGTIGIEDNWRVGGEGGTKSVIFDTSNSESITNIASGILNQTNINLGFVGGNPPTLVLQNRTNGPANFLVSGTIYGNFVSLTNSDIAVFNTVTDMVSGIATNVCVVRSRTGTNGLGGGMFSLLSTNGYATNAGTVFASTTPTKYWVRMYEGYLDVTWFGAKGDGATDDIDAITNAINTASWGNTIYFPLYETKQTGEYVVSRTIEVTNKFLNFKGAGKASYANGCRVTGTVAGPLFRISYLPAATQAPTFEDMNLLNYSPTGTGVYMGQAVGGAILNCTIVAHHGVNFPLAGDPYSADGTFNCFVSGTSLSWFNVIGGSMSNSVGVLNGSMINCDISGFDSGFRSSGQQQVTITGCRIETCTNGIALGLLADGSNGLAQGVFVGGNSFEANDVQILVHSAANCTFVGMTMQGSVNSPSAYSKYGIKIDTATKCSFQDLTAVGDYSVVGISVDPSSSDIGFKRVVSSNSGTGTNWSVLGGDGLYTFEDSNYRQGSSFSQLRAIGRTGRTEPFFQVSDTNNLPVLTVQTNSMVGIGTTNPLALLDVGGQMRISGSVGGLNFAPRSGSGNSPQLFNADGSALILYVPGYGNSLYFMDGGDVRASTKILATNGFAGFATNIVVDGIYTAGFTNSAAFSLGSVAMSVNVQATSGTLEFYNKGGLNGQTVASVPLYTNVLTATAVNYAVGVNDGFIIRSPVGMIITAKAFP